MKRLAIIVLTKRTNSQLFSPVRLTIFHSWISVSTVSEKSIPNQQYSRCNNRASMGAHSLFDFHQYGRLQYSGLEKKGGQKTIWFTKPQKQPDEYASYFGQCSFTAGNLRLQFGCVRLRGRFAQCRRTKRMYCYDSSTKTWSWSELTRKRVLYHYFNVTGR